MKRLPDPMPYLYKISIEKIKIERQKMIFPLPPKGTAWIRLVFNCTSYIKSIKWEKGSIF